MKRNLIHIAAATATCVVALAMATPKAWAKKKVQPTKVAPVKTLSYNDKRRFDYFFLEAVKQENIGNYASALDLMNHCLAINPNAAEVYFMQAPYYVQLKKDSLALACLEKAATLRPDNSTFTERLGQFYINSGNFDKAIQTYEKLTANTKETGNSDALNVLMQLYGRQKDFNGVLKTLNKIEIVNGITEETTLQKVRAYEMLDDKTSAFKALKQLCDDHPNDVNYKLMLGNWLMQNQKEADAHKIFTAVLAEDPDNTFAQASLYDYYRAKNNDAMATQLRDKMLISPKTDNETKLSIMKQVVQESERTGGDSTAVLALFDKITSANPNDGNMAELKAAYMSVKNMPDSLVNNALRQVVAVAPENTGARLQLIQSLWKKQRWDEILTLSKQAQAYTPEEMVFYYFEGMANYQIDKKDQALDAFKRGVSQINPKSDKEIVAEFYELMGEILYQKKQYKEAFAAYDSCLQWKPDKASCLNNYAYYLGEQGKDLDKAEAMSYKAIKNEPNNGTYLDTYAWLLFLKKRYAEAQVYIEQALKNDSTSLKSKVVLEHAGDIYAMNGDTKKAIEYWNMALKLGADKAVINRKIKMKKP